MLMRSSTGCAENADPVVYRMCRKCWTIRLQDV